MLGPLILLLAAASHAPVQATPYACSVKVEVDGLTGSMWRNFEPNEPDELYVLQLDSGLRAMWMIDNRPSAGRKRYRFRTGRPEADVFRQGPDYVEIGNVRFTRLDDAPVWAYLYGDGIYVGAFLLQSARQSRSLRLAGGQGIQISVAQPHNKVLIGRLAQARDWHAVLVQNGRELGRTSTHVPSPARVKAAFEKARSELLAHRTAFIAGNAPHGGSGACEYQDDML